MGTDVRFADIEAATRKQAAAQERSPSGGFVLGYGFVMAVAEAVGWSDEDVPRGYPKDRAYAAFRAKIVRALGKMTAEGALVKAGDVRAARWYTPAEWELDLSARSAREAEKTLMDARANDVRARLAELDVALGPLVMRDDAQLSQWEKLLRLAEAGKWELGA
jgi:hypothetical protein